MKEGLAAFTDTYLTSIGLTIFFVFFIATIIWVNLRGNKERYARIEQVLFSDGEQS